MNESILLSHLYNVGLIDAPDRERIRDEVGKDLPIATKGLDPLDLYQLKPI